MPQYLEEIYALTENATVFAAIGTSGQVYPAANFVHVAGEGGARTMEFNLESSGVFGEFVPGPAARTVTAWVDSPLGGEL